MPATFQSMISALQSYWEEQGCTIMQPHHTEVGAGTSNPATFLRVLGPKPWRTGYVEPSIRPDDGRYGENPFRFQQFYQYHEILAGSESVGGARDWVRFAFDDRWHQALRGCDAGSVSPC